MIFSRMIEHVKKQHWTGALIELVIVVLGVFLGLQAQNWNQARADRGIVARHLTEIAEDLQLRHQQEDSLIQSALDRVSAVNYVLAQGFDEKPPKSIIINSVHFSVPETAPISGDHLNHLMSAIDTVRASFAARNGYQSLIASGHLGLIQNRNLARAIQHYYNSYDDIVDTEKGVLWAFRNNGAAVLYKYGVSEFGARPPRDIVALAKTHPDFTAYLRTQREWAVLQVNLLEQQDEATVKLLNRIHKELGRLQ